MKGQKSLAMIVSMSIIGVVILVSIGVIQDTASSFQDAEVLDAELESFRDGVCESRCSEVQAGGLKDVLEYCVESTSMSADGEVVGGGFNSYCSDGVKCFNVHSCSFRAQALNAGNCRQLMCQHFDESGLSDSEAGERVYSYFEKDKAVEGDYGAGTCDLSSVTDSANYTIANWWTENFESGVSGDYASICG